MHGRLHATKDIADLESARGAGRAESEKHVRIEMQQYRKMEVMRLAGPQASLLTVSIFFIAVVSLNFFVQRFWFKHAWQVIGKIRQRAARIAFQSAWFAAVFVVFLGVLDWALRGHHLLPRDGRMAWFASFVRLWLTTSLLALVAIETVRLIKNLYSHSVPATGSADRQTGVNRSRRNFFRYATCLAGSLPFVAAAYGFTDERFEYQIRRVRIPVTNWPKELDGLTIVQVSDIHASEFMPRYEIRRAIEMANGLEADLAVVTGDFITGENDPLAECIDEIGRLRAPLGVWGCNGNHEIYAGVEALAQQLFQQHSMRLLRLQNSELSWHGAKFNLIGVDYQREYGGSASMLRHVEPLVRRNIPNILLSHNPNSFYRAAEMGIELSLAGHTHGGQVKVEILDHSLSPARFMSEFIAGPYRLPFGSAARTGQAVSQNNANSAALYVNRGLGTVGMPVRIGVPPEITLMTLKTATA